MVMVLVLMVVGGDCVLIAGGDDCEFDAGDGD